ncbi:DCC1-like thiol-disulfide oxidoreductase family protein [Candidatus Poriferisodalis sp.]|uniref:DCC1-like thiol-disulfide oxidoreductase family protein n=1 Tax=Candidatus Poriferisodalis sp. TaxID=3101277 RepID=UPI003B02AE10
MSFTAADDRTQTVEATRSDPSSGSLRIRRVLRRGRAALRSTEADQQRTPAALMRRAHDVVLLGRFYYVFLAYLVGTGHYPFGDAYSGGPPTAPLWPIRFMAQLVGTDWLRHEIALTAVGLAFALGAAAAPGVFALRLGAFMHLFTYLAIRNSYGSINHGTHVLLLVGFALLFLPGRRSLQRRAWSSVRSCLTALWLAQVAILLAYTLSGIWKIWYGRMEVFSADALTRILADRLFAEADEIPLLLPIVMQHDWLTQPMWLTTLYLEIFALFVVSRPHLHRPFGAAFMLFHISSDLLMNISFSLNIVMVGLFLLVSPLAPERFSLSGTVRSLPVVGLPFRLLRRRQQSRQPSAARQRLRVWLVYDGECPMCANYARYLRLRQSVGELTLVDARQGGPMVDEVRRLPHDLDDGMVAKVNDQYYVGHEALNVLALLATDRGAFNKFNRLAFGWPLISRVAYPLMTAVRRLLLKRKGVTPIGDDSGG